MGDAAAWYEDDRSLEAELRNGYSSRRGSARVSGYDRLEEIGRGGQATVYRARQISTGRTVALKLIHDAPGRAAATLRRFEREVETVASLRHPSIVTLHDGGVTPDGRPWLAMEYVSGRPIDECPAARSWHEGAANVEPLLRLFASVSSAVAAAHARGIIHRDLKPANVLVDDAGIPRILDFGLARIDDDPRSQAALSADGTFIGSLAWASPEQARGEPADVRSDVYALGLVFHAVLAGKAPLAMPADLRAALDLVAEPEITPIEHACPRVDADTAAIIGRAIAIEPERRYSSAAELARDIERRIRGEPVEARRESTWHLVGRRLRRWRRALIAGAVTLVLLATALGFTLSSLADAREARSREAAESKRLAATLDWLVSMISKVDPEVDGEDVRLLDVIERTSGELDTAFAGDVRSRILLHRTLAGLEEKLGKSGAAEYHYRRLLDDLVASGEADPEEILAARGAILRMRFVQTRTVDLSPEIRPLLAEMRERLGPTHDATISLGKTLVSNLRARRDLASARRVVEELLEDGGEDLEPLRRLDIEEYLVAIESMAGRPERALDMQRHIVESRERLQGPEAVPTLTSRSDLAYYLGDLDRLDDAEAVLRDNESRALSKLGAEHPISLSIAEQLAKLIQDQGRPSEAIPLFESILERRAKRLGTEHPNTLGTMNNLAVARGLSGDLEGALAIQQKLVALLRRTEAPDEFDVINGLSNLGTILCRLGRPDEALPSYREAVTRSEKALGRAHWQDATFRILLAHCLTLRREFDEAEQLLLDARPVLEKALGPEHPNTKKAHALLQALHAARTQNADGED